MDPKKVIVCRCEDVTLADVYDAIEKGYRDIESIKRYLRIGMGPCGGTHCIPIITRILAKKLGKNPEELFIPRHRPPLVPVPFKLFITSGKERR